MGGMQALLNEFNRILGLGFGCPADLAEAAERVLGAVDPAAMRTPAERKQQLLALVNSRLNLNRFRIKQFLGVAAKQGIYFNYREKRILAGFFDRRQRHAFGEWLRPSSPSPALIEAFLPISESETLDGLHRLLATGHVNRSDARECSLAEKQALIQRALFGCFVFRAFQTKAMHQVFNEDAAKAYHGNFFNHLLLHHPEQMHRDCALIHEDLDLARLMDQPYAAAAGNVLRRIAKNHERLSNHCYLTIRLRHATGSEPLMWRLFSDIVLFAEKHRQVALKKKYFDPHAIRKATKEYIGRALDEDAAQFNLCNEGFFFKDCYILAQAATEGSSEQPYDLLLMFEKNERDDRLLPCPACRSFNVTGNSYSPLGVRGWECRNPICPERSAYDRGNRYSLASIIRQEAIASEADQIPGSVIKRWRNDVIFGVTDQEVTEMLIRNFTLHKDTVVFVNGSVKSSSLHGRQLVCEMAEESREAANVLPDFHDSPFFKRYLLKRAGKSSVVPFRQEKLGDAVLLVNGDCETGMDALAENSVDGAVTSPPYYNAREYSQWPNVYCYLHDMFNAAKSTLRVLKPGSLYVFNVFDYFDNEKTVASSSLGKKRMILGAYIIHLFEAAGFETLGNVPWFKGEIEGKRNFNQGNASPYYQLPFNSWEHCLVFRKPGAASALPALRVLKQHPVCKMVRGINTHGHTAPFPVEIPQLLISALPLGSTVLDPYGGSMTTAVAALRAGMRAISFEKDPDYFELGLGNVQKAITEQEEDLFGHANAHQPGRAMARS